MQVSVYEGTLLVDCPERRSEDHPTGRNARGHIAAPEPGSAGQNQYGVGGTESMEARSEVAIIGGILAGPRLASGSRKPRAARILPATRSVGFVSLLWSFRAAASAIKPY